MKYTLNSFEDFLGISFYSVHKNEFSKVLLYKPLNKLSFLKIRKYSGRILFGLQQIKNFIRLFRISIFIKLCAYYTSSHFLKNLIFQTVCCCALNHTYIWNIVLLEYSVYFYLKELTWIIMFYFIKCFNQRISKTTLKIYLYFIYVLVFPIYPIETFISLSLWQERN